MDVAFRIRTAEIHDAILRCARSLDRRAPAGHRQARTLTPCHLQKTGEAAPGLPHPETPTRPTRRTSPARTSYQTIGATEPDRAGCACGDRSSPLRHESP